MGSKKEGDVGKMTNHCVNKGHYSQDNRDSQYGVDFYVVDQDLCNDSESEQVQVVSKMEAAECIQHKLNRFKKKENQRRPWGWRWGTQTTVAFVALLKRETWALQSSPPYRDLVSFLGEVQERMLPGPSGGGGGGGVGQRKRLAMTECRVARDANANAHRPPNGACAAPTCR